MATGEGSGLNAMLRALAGIQRGSATLSHPCLITVMNRGTGPSSCIVPHVDLNHMTAHNQIIITVYDKLGQEQRGCNDVKDPPKGFPSVFHCRGAHPDLITCTASSKCTH